MKRVLMIGFLLLVSSSACQLPAEREPLRPLPEDRAPPPYAELLTRARLQATVATEAFYVDKWAELEEAAKGLEQTARFLPKAQDIPPKQKEVLPRVSESLAKEAVLLRDGAKDKDAKKVNETLQRIQSTVCELRLDQ